MTAFGRLWARAPAWRAALLLTIGCGALAALFPPGQPQVAVPARLTPAVVRAEPVAAPVQAPAPASTLAAAPGANIPVPGQIYSDRLPFGSQSVPLPPGHWLAVAVGNDPQASDVPHSSVFLALVLGQRVAAAATDQRFHGGRTARAGFLVPADAQIPAFYYRRVLMAVDHGPADFWLCGSSLPSEWSDPCVTLHITALAQQHIDVADRFDWPCSACPTSATGWRRNSCFLRPREKGRWVVDGGGGFIGCSGASAHRKGATLGQGVARRATSRLRRWRRSWRQRTHTIAVDVANRA